jgi:hypothetical protein
MDVNENWIPTDELWSLDLDTMVWANITSPSGPDPRSFASAIPLGTDIYVISGCFELSPKSMVFNCALFPRNSGGASDMWLFNTTSSEWQQLAPDGLQIVGMSSVSPLNNATILAYYISGEEEQSALATYDTIVNSWITFDQQPLGTLPEGRIGCNFLNSDKEGVYFLYGGILPMFVVEKSHS